MKFGIITFASAHNYGAFYQVYAMQTYLEKLGHKVDIINYRPNSIDKVYKLYKFKPKMRKKKKIKYFVKRTWNLLTKEKWKTVKYLRFEKAIRYDLNTTKVFRTLKELKEYEFEYDYILAGSDQIWNFDLTKKCDPSYFIDFGKKDIVRIAYAASVGRDELSPTEGELFKKYLKNFDHISIREETTLGAIQPLTEKEVRVVQDPTFLVGKDVYDQFKTKSKYAKKKYVYVHFIGGPDDDVIATATQIAEILGVPVLHNSKQGLFENELDSRMCISPSSMLSVIEKAEFVVSNSFHFTVLPIIYQKEFATIAHKQRPGRMQNLLKNLELSDRLVIDSSSLNFQVGELINYEAVNQKIEDLRAGSIKYIDECIQMGKAEHNNYFSTGHEFDCYNCSLCKYICPVNAISMEEDNHGYPYPVIDKDKCTSCTLCEKRCIKGNYKILDEEVNKLFAVRNKSDQILLESASGGIMHALHQYTLDNKGHVVGVRYNKNMEPTYDISNTNEGVAAFHGSKYVECVDNNTYPRVKELLNNGTMVLFSGSPCKIAGLKSYLGKDYSNLITVDIICHGVPSKKVFRHYLKSLEERNNKKIVDFTFRDKNNGWVGCDVVVKFQDGTSKRELAKYNNYNLMFANDWMLRPSCYSCEFTGDNQIADITVGDFWKIEKYMKKFDDNKGTSIFKINSHKGIKIWNEIKDNFIFEESNLKDAYEYNHKRPVVYSAKRVEFMNEFEYDNIHEYITKNNRFKIVTKKNKTNAAEKNRANSL